MFPASDPVDSEGLASAKKDMRRKATRLRERLHGDVPNAGAGIAGRFSAAWTPAPGTAVSAFWPIRTEPDTRPLMRTLHAAGCTVLLPVVAGRDRPLVFRAWAPDDPLEAGDFGVRVPRSSAPVLEPDWLLVPLLAWDAGRYRLGYGGGFYDMTLSALRARRAVRAIGVGFDGLQVDRVPRGPCDQRLDAVLTESRIVRGED